MTDKKSSAETMNHIAGEVVDMGITSGEKVSEEQSAALQAFLSPLYYRNKTRIDKQLADAFKNEWEDREQTRENASHSASAKGTAKTNEAIASVTTYAKIYNGFLSHSLTTEETLELLKKREGDLLTLMLPYAEIRTSSEKNKVTPRRLDVSIERMRAEYEALESEYNKCVELRKYLTGEHPLEKPAFLRPPHDEKPRIEEMPPAPQFSPAENAVMALYPQFKSDYQKLIDHGYMQKNGDYLRWLKSKKCLAEYFGHRESADRQSHWKEIEVLFSVNSLYQSFQNSKNDKQSKDYQDLIEILSKQNLVVSK